MAFCTLQLGISLLRGGNVAVQEVSGPSLNSRLRLTSLAVAVALAVPLAEAMAEATAKDMAEATSCSYGSGYGYSYG